MNKEPIADIRNRLQSSMTALDFMPKGKEVPKELIEIAKRDLDEIVLLLARVDSQNI